jgi:hypothetical protein
LKHLALLRTLCLFILSVQLLFPDFVLAQADGSRDATYNNGVINPEQIALVPAEDRPKDLAEFTERDKEMVREYMSHGDTTLRELSFLLQKQFNEVRKQEAEIGLKALYDKVAKRQNTDSVEYEREGLGKAEPLVYSHNEKYFFFTKARHNGLKRIILYVDLDYAKLDIIEQVPNSNLSKEAFAEELQERRVFSHYIRKLASRMIMQEWSSELYYQRGRTTDAASSLPDSIQEKVHEIMTASGEQLESKSWFQNILKNAADITAQIESAERMKGGWDVMLVGYSSSKQEIVASELITKPIIFKNRGSLSANVSGALRASYQRWVMYWHHIWEPPEYNKDVWKNNKGIKKLKVLLTGDYFNGLYWGTKLGIISLITTFTFQTMLPVGLDPVMVAKNSFLFSTFFGVFSKTWTRFTGKNSDFRTFAKNLLPGYAQSYSMQLASDVNLNPFKDGAWDPAAAKIHTDIAINQALKSDAKTGLQEEARLRFYNGQAQGKVIFRYPKFRMPSKELPIFSFEIVDREIRLPVASPDITNPEVVRNLKEANAVSEISIPYKDIQIRIPWITWESWTSDISQKSFESQKVQNITTPVGQLSRFGYTVDVMGVPLPIGHIAYAALGPYGKFKALNAHENYLKHLMESVGPEHPETKRQLKATQDARDYWAAMRLFSPYLPYRRLMNAIDEFNTLKQQKGADHTLTLEAEARMNQLRETWENLRWQGIPYTQVLGYYPRVIVDAISDLAQWTGRNLLYQGYKAYRAFDKALAEIEQNNRSVEEARKVYMEELGFLRPGHPAENAKRSFGQVVFENFPEVHRVARAVGNSLQQIETHRLETQAATNTMNRLNLVRGEDGKPHPQHVDAVNARLTCSLLFGD